MLKKSIPIQLDKQRNLRFTTNAVCLLEEKLGVAFLNLREMLGFHEGAEEDLETVAAGKKLSEKKALKLMQGLKLTSLRLMLHVALLHEEPNLTLDEAGLLIDSSDKFDVLGKLMEAYHLAIYEGKAGEEKKA